MVIRIGEVSGKSRVDSLVTPCPTLIYGCSVFGDSDDWNWNWSWVVDFGFSLLGFLSEKYYDLYWESFGTASIDCMKWKRKQYFGKESKLSLSIL